MGKKSMRRLGRAMTAGIERRDPMVEAQKRVKQKASEKPHIIGLRGGYKVPPSLGGRIDKPR